MRSLTINQTVMSGGLYSLSNVTLNASSLTLAAATSTIVRPIPTATATLDSCVIGINSTVTMVGSGGALELLNITGKTTNNGVINVLGGSAGPGTRTGSTTGEIDIGYGATFTNNGVITKHYSSNDSNPQGYHNQWMSLSIIAKSPGSTFINNGTIIPDRIKIDADMIGNGKILFAVPVVTPMALEASSVEVNRTVGTGQVFDMTNGGSLRITDFKDFHGIIRGFRSDYDSGLVPGSSVSIVHDVIDVAGLGTSVTALDRTASPRRRGSRLS